MLSVVLATYNEEKNISRCLKSINSLADEIIIVDGQSTDQTCDIAKKFGAKIYQTTNKLNFHLNKQMAMNKATGNLVLQLDADEVVDQELAAFIKKIKIQVKKNHQDLKNTTVAWYIKRKNYFLKTWLKKGGQYPDPVIRLYINGCARLPQQDVHEQMIVDGPIAIASGHILHYSYPHFTDYLRKFNHYTNLKALQLANQNIAINFMNSGHYLLWQPIKTFFLLYFRHLGILDGIAGFIFALFSSLYHVISYLKLWEKKYVS